MSETTTPPVESKNQVTPPESKPANTPEESKTTPPENVPYSQFSEKIGKKNDEIAALRAQVEKAKADQEAIRKAELEQKGEYKTLLEENEKKLAAATEKATAFDNYVADKKAKLLEKIPEEKRALYEGIDLVVLEDMVSTLETKQINHDGSAPGGGRDGKYPGGYESKVTFAQGDPAGYEKWRTEQQAIKPQLGKITLPGQEPYIR